MLTDIADEAVEWRHRIHEYPELLFDLPRTSAYVAELLRSFECDEVHTGIAVSGVVAVVNGNRPGRTIGLRCDMDALPIHEQTNLPYASKVDGRMHACGHDGHTAILLAAAKALANNRNFSGKVILIFQPAEEGGGGGRVMVEEGMLERFGIEEVFGMHNQPNLPIGRFATRSGPILGSADMFSIRLTGAASHAAYPHMGRDTVVGLASLVTALQTISSRSTDPMDSVAVSVVRLEAGQAEVHNVIPGEGILSGTVRTLRQITRQNVEARLREIAAGVATMHRLNAEVEWTAGYPVTMNDTAATRTAIAAAKQIAGAEGTDGEWPAVLGAEDFSYMLEQRPGAFMWLGNGEGPDVHTPHYNFNDDAIIHGLRYWLALVGQELA
ncbi:amidohydrolase [Tianweitania sp.]|uniref:amidohydrolase n=1 Tax=Tianweitania sp. TaxID=2021634 RepID=UPI003A0FD192